MTWVLVVWLAAFGNTHGVAVAIHGYKSSDACAVALAHIMKQTDRARAYCIPGP